jgi:hypothetical protein
MVANSQHFDEELDPNESESWIRIRMKVISWIRIRIRVMRIRNPGRETTQLFLV